MAACFACWLIFVYPDILLFFGLLLEGVSWAIIKLQDYTKGEDRRDHDLTECTDGKTKKECVSV